MACVLGALVAAAAAASAAATTVPWAFTANLVKGREGEEKVSFDVPVAAGEELEEVAARWCAAQADMNKDTCVPLVVPLLAQQAEKARPVVASINMTLADGSAAPMTLRMGEDAVTEVRRWLQANNAVTADVDKLFRSMLVALNVPGVVAVTANNLLTTLALSVGDSGTFQVPLLTNEVPEESVLGFLHRIGMLATLPYASMAQVARAARNLHTDEMAKRERLSLSLAGTNLTIDFSAMTEDMGMARAAAADTWNQLNETVRAGLNETAFVVNVSRAMFRAARATTGHPFYDAPWDTTITISLGADSTKGELNLKAGDSLRDAVAQVCAARLDDARSLVSNAATDDDVIVECGRRLLPALMTNFVKGQ